MVVNIGFPIYVWDARIHRFGHILERVSNRLPSYNDPFGVLECVVLDAFWNGFGAVYYLRTFGLGCENRGPRRLDPPFPDPKYDPFLEAIERVNSDFGGAEAGAGLAGGWAGPLNWRQWSYFVVKTRAPHLRGSEAHAYRASFGSSSR